VISALARGQRASEIARVKVWSFKIPPAAPELINRPSSGRRVPNFHQKTESKARLSPSTGGIRPGEEASLLNPIVTKRAAMSAGEHFGLCKCEGTMPAERLFDVPVPNYHLLVRPDIFQNARQPEQVVFALLHEMPALVEVGLPRSCRPIPASDYLPTFSDFAVSRCFCNVSIWPEAYSPAASLLRDAFLYSAISFWWSATM
jgi:hypothetical protein